MKYEIPTEADKDALFSKNPIDNEKIMAWIAGKWPVDKEQVLDNTKFNRWSAYNVFAK